MKKAILAGLTVLLALVMVTCDAFPPVDVVPLNETGNQPEITYDTDGTPLVNLTIKTGGTPSRALSEALAKDWVDYYEVAFVSPDGKIFRARWKLGTVGRIAVPHGNYNTVDPDAVVPSPTNTTGAAIMFAGKYETRNLLAVGELVFTSNTDGETDTKIIDHDTISVTFELTALSIDVQVDYPDKSSFQITQTALKTADISSADFPKVKYNSELIPVFEVETAYDKPATWKDATATVAVASTTAFVEFDDNSEFTVGTVVRFNGTTIVEVVDQDSDGVTVEFDNPVTVTTASTVELEDVPAVPATATLNTATYTVNDGAATTPKFPHKEGVFLLTPKLFSVGVLAQNPTNVGGFALDLTAGGSTINLQPGAPVNGSMSEDGIFDLELVVPPNKSGLSWLAIDIPVRAISADPDINGDIWHIQGGLKNGNFDLGAVRESLGGAILLGADIDITIEIEINSTWK